MSIRDILKQREEARDKAASGDSEFPEGVTRYVRMGRHGEVNSDGRTFIMLADPNDWFFYFVHEDKTYNGKGYDHGFRKHTCAHSPKNIGADLAKYFRPGKDECLSCKAGAKRKMFAMIPVYDLEYKTYRVIDTVEFHINNLIADYDKLEGTAKKFAKDYTLVGDAVHIKQVDKTYSLESGDATEEEIESAKEFIGYDFGFEELANFREDDDILAILYDAEDSAINKSVLPEKKTEEASEAKESAEDFGF